MAGESATVEGEAATQPSTPAGEQSADQLVTPELQAKFDETFGGGGQQDGGQQTPTLPDHQRQQEEQESLSSLENASWEDTGSDQFQGQEPGRDEGGEQTRQQQDDDSQQRQGQEEGQDEQGEQPQSTLNPILRHAAKRNGWNDEEIQQLEQADPDLAQKTFQRLHQFHSDLSAQYARLGQQGQPQQQQPGMPGQTPQPGMQPGQPMPGQQPQPGQMGQPPQPGQPQPGQQPQPTQQTQQAANILQSQDPVQAIFGQNIDQLGEKYGQDFLDEVVKPMVNTVVSPMKDMYQHYEQQQQQAVHQEVNGFFQQMSSDLSEVYGDESQGMSDEQVQARHEMAQLADQIRAGAAQQGVDMSISEALDRASMMHAAQHLETIERNKLRQQVKNRSAQLTSRPTHRSTGPTSQGGDQPPSEQGAQQAYQQRAQELGLEI